MVDQTCTDDKDTFYAQICAQEEKQLQLSIEFETLRSQVNATLTPCAPNLPRALIFKILVCHFVFEKFLS